MEKLKIGMFGLGIKSGVYRGQSYIHLMMKEPRIEVAAVCDWDVGKSGLEKELINIDKYYVRNLHICIDENQILM